MTEEEREEFYESLPVEWQARIEAMRRNMRNMGSHAEIIADVITSNMETLDAIEQETDPTKARVLLFIRAEEMEKTAKDDEFMRDLCSEYAREYDWIRHTLDDAGTDIMSLAVEMVRKAQSCSFDKAEILSGGLNIRKYEADAIIAYWKKTQED